MRIPESIKIGCYTYAVEYVENLRGENDERLAGQCDYQKLIIRLRTGMPEQRTREVFLHEVIHAVDFAGEIGLSEKKVTRLSLGLMAALLDNDLLAKGE